MNEAQPTPPVARREPVERRFHDDVFIDHYEWLRDKSSPEVIAHLEAENAYTDAITADQQALRDAMFDEIKSRTREAAATLPTRHGDWWYYSRMIEGGQHPIYCRVPAAAAANSAAGWVPPTIDVEQLPADEQVLLDANAQSQRYDFYALGGFDVSDDGHKLAWLEDTNGDERFTLHVRNLETGELQSGLLSNLAHGIEFFPDNESLLYSLVDDSWRPHEIHRYWFHDGRDELLLRESDPEMWLSAGVSDNRRFLIAEIGNSEVSEIRLWPLVDGTGLNDDGFTTVLGREARTLYEAEPLQLDGRDTLAVLHQYEQPNGELVLVELDAIGAATSIAELEPRILVAGDDTNRLLSVTNAGTHLVLDAMQEGLPQVLVLPLNKLDAQPLRPHFNEPLVGVSSVALDYGAPVLRVAVDSWVRATRQFEIEFTELEGGAAPVLRHEIDVPNYSADNYRAQREWATAADGTRIPLTVLSRADVALDGTAAALVYGYGSYELSLDPYLSVPIASVLDRGVVLVIAHVRGGGELGRRWYEDGKKLRKNNSFTDFIAATAHLSDAGLVDGDRIAAFGGSAGGLLMGAVANLAPERYRAIVAQVPFVDPLTSILDPDLPLSALEWEEWGNPITDPEAYAYIKSYSPYENVRAVAYPAIAAVTSLHDTRVLYVEPAKWVAKLREVSTGTNPIVLKTEMHGGHGGGSGRYQRWRNRAWDHAFMLAALGVIQ